MTAASLKFKFEKSSFENPKENVGPGQTSLYFKNVGLFSDPYLNKLNEPTKDEFINKHWETESLPNFNEAYEWMLSTWEEMKDVLPTLSEAQLENKWIQPILSKLGWEYEVQDRLKKWGKTEIPDYSLFDSKKTYLKAQGCKTDEAYFEHVLAVADAKQMGVSLDGSKLDKTNPSYQIIWYQQITGKNWGILTDGRYWRIYSLRSKSKFTSYYEINIEKMLVERDDDQFKYFFNFFRKDALIKLPNTDQCFLDVLFEKGERYAREVETKLKDRAFHLVEQICNGFLADMENPPTEKQLVEVYENSLHYLFRLMFILNCEAKGLLNVDKQSHYYVHSLRHLCYQLKSESESNVSWSAQPRSYSHISMLFNLLEKGDSSIGIHGFGDEVFNNGNKKFFKNLQIPDKYLIPVLLELAFAKDEKENSLRLIDYKRLSADHLGSLFEGLLEFRLEKTGRSQFQLVNSSGERKASGSFYTPEHIVDYIVKTTLDPVVKNLSEEEILNLKIIDPAMGSGHFLLGVVKYLESKIIERITEVSKAASFDPYEIRWKILHSCLHGIDINPLAVELAKYSLWIYSAQNKQKLEPLDDQFICGDSLFDLKNEAATKNSVAGIIEQGGFEVIVGNPPYVYSRSLGSYKQKLESTDYVCAEYQPDLYIYFLERAIKLVRKDGVIGFITPNSFLHYKTMTKIRHLLIKENTILEITKAYNVFKDATVDTVILNITKKRPKADYRFPLNEIVNEEMSFLRTCETSTLGDELTINLGKAMVEIKDLSKMEKNSQILGELCNITMGIKMRPEFIAKEVKKKSYVPLIKGRNIFPFSLKWTNDYIDYSKSAEQKYPNQALRKPENFTEPKILMRQTAENLIAVFDTKGFYSMQSTYSLTSKKGNDVSLKYIAAILNSSLMRDYYSTKFKKDKSVFPQIRAYDLKELPIKLGSKSQIAEVEKIYDSLCKIKPDFLEGSDQYKNLNLLIDLIYLKSEVKNLEKLKRAV
jgi:type I restriction-modification system DNA methylase subunit